jgi:hypothetical protein
VEFSRVERHPRRAEPQNERQASINDLEEVRNDRSDSMTNRLLGLKHSQPKLQKKCERSDVMSLKQLIRSGDDKLHVQFHKSLATGGFERALALNSSREVLNGLDRIIAMRSKVRSWHASVNSITTKS